ncbi:MAG: hypothetical protein GX638_15230 [Crenarchaeota archaeon]|nr:hypothetical protein [Thermoproteota archaeon]
MRINFTRLGLIIIIIGVLLFFEASSTHAPQMNKLGGAYVEPGDTFSYGLFLSPFGLGNLVVESDMLFAPTPEPNATRDADGGTFVDKPVIRQEYVVPVHLVVINPSNLTIVDTDLITPHTVQIDFNQRGKYIVHLTNLDNQSYPMSISLKFPKDSGIENIPADRVLFSSILTTCGVIVFCIGLSSTLIMKRKKCPGKKTAKI